MMGVLHMKLDLRTLAGSDERSELGWSTSSLPEFLIDGMKSCDEKLSIPL